MSDQDNIAALVKQLAALDSEQAISAAYDALKVARRNLRAVEQVAARASLAIGDRVRTKGLSPKYLNGLTGEVAAVTQTRVGVMLDHSTMAFRYEPANGGPLFVPLTCVEKRDA